MTNKLNPEIIERFILPGESNSDISIRSLLGGRNNNLTFIQINERKLVLKSYSNNGDWPRLLTEYSFVSFLHQYRIDNVPKPISSIPKYNSALYSYISGNMISCSTDLIVKECIEFILAINKKTKNSKDKFKNCIHSINIKKAS